VDASTFIHALALDRAPLLARLRSPLAFVEYVYRTELAGAGAHAKTREAAVEQVRRGAITVDRLSMADVVRMSAFAPPRRVDTGELATAVVADRLGVGVLCDDHKAVVWLREKLSRVREWEAIEEVLVAAAVANLIGESELPELQGRLVTAKYRCRYDLRRAYAQIWFREQQARSKESSGADAPVVADDQADEG
jgi:hypothetical protein